MKKSILSLGIPAVVLAGLASMSIGANNAESDKRAKNVKEAVPRKAFAEPKSDRKVLVFTVTNGWKHPSIPTGIEAMKQMGKKTGAFKSVVSNDLANFEEDKIKEFDAIIFLNTTGDVLKPHPKKLQEMSKGERKAANELEKKLQANLMDFIKSGKGFVGIHAATDTYYTWPQYGEMMNGYFNGHPWGAKTDVVVDVEKGQKDHPLVSMLNGRSFEFKEEIYEHKEPYDSENVHMLLRLNQEESKRVKGIKRSDGDFGVSWIRPWGEGRVFYCSLGHNHAMYWNEKVLKHYLAGIQWALGDLEAPVEIK